MNILITAGGTSEKIDSVRKISNTATGRLGALIADEFNKNSAKIIYVCGENAVVPTGVTPIKVTSSSALSDIMEQLLSEHRFDAVIHTMAVSDYTVRGALSVDDLAAAVAKAIKPGDGAEQIKDIILLAASQNVNSKKISSDVNNLMIFARKTPKIINMLKKLQPKTLLIGFKLLVGARFDELLDVGHELLVKNNCDYVFANDLEKINGDNHEGILIFPNRSYQKLHTKQEIAKAIVGRLIAVQKG
ncbi:MAG: phosphopantothenate--cysteine ligase [Oscillospiraceae bacterium]|nr:phosphopantothenate--cysteine ligase [Oscillospiraceae bacterium]